jgi:hypothetical protein
MTYDQLTDLLYLVRGGRLETAEKIIEKALEINTMPTKIVGPNLEQILNAAGFYKREWVGLTVEEIKEILYGLLEDDRTPMLTVIDAVQEKLKEKNGA